MENAILFTEISNILQCQGLKVKCIGLLIQFMIDYFPKNKRKGKNSFKINNQFYIT